MSEIPILVSTEMVRAILTCAQCGTITIEIKCPKCGSEERIKTQTRRIVKARKLHPDYGIPQWDEAFVDGKPPEPYLHVPFNGCETGRTVHRHYPKWEIGDTLWVREAWWDLGFWDKGKWFGRTRSHTIGPAYVADGEPEGQISKKKRTHLMCKWRKRPSIHMPRWAARIFLEITNIRVERVQDITHCDIFREGVDVDSTPKEEYPDNLKNAFKELWDSLNAKQGYGWDKNPWVWVIEFKRIEQ